MAGSIPDSKIEEIRHAADIVAVVRDHVVLKRSGVNYKGLCPFHREKTPSFMVHPERQFFHCFGCGEAGDVFSFVMKQERVDFLEAARLLARRFGVSLPESPGASESKESKSQLYDINLWAAKLFQQCLLHPEIGAAAREYLDRRGLTKETIARFQLGFAPPGPRKLLEAARRKGISEGLLARAGLIYPEENGRPPVDRFRNRVIFPIRDVQGRVVGFGARTLGDEEPKYLNSPETPLFQKSKILYAMDLAKEALREKRHAIVAEGYMDVIMAHQHNLKETVAVLGTALTEHHVRQLRRYVDEVTLVFDADRAGQSSADRSVEAFIAEEMPLRVMTLPEGKDPCDFLLESGREAFESLLSQAPDWLDFKLARAKAEAPHGRLDSSIVSARVLDGTLECIGLVPNPVARDLMITRVANAMNISPRALMERMAALTRKTYRRETATERMARPREPERELLFVLLADNSLAPQVRNSVRLESIEDLAAQVLLRRFFALAESKSCVTAQDLLLRTPEPEYRKVIEEAFCFEFAPGEAATICAELLERLRRKEADRLLSALNRELEEAIRSGEEERLREALRRRQELLRARPPQTKACTL